MKKIKPIQVILITLVLVLTVYLIASLMKQKIQREMIFQTQRQPTNSNTNVPKSLTEFQDCVDRANRSEAEQSIIDDSIRKCEMLYKP